MWQRIVGRIVTSPFAFALGGLVEAATYWRSRLSGRDRDQISP